MVPTAWTAVHRPTDGEHVGWLAPAPGGLVQPVDLTGSPAGPPGPRGPVTAGLADRGLAVLAGRRWCRLPDPLPRGVTEAAEPRPDWPWRPVVLVEVSPAAVHLRPEWPAPAETGARAVLPVPVGDRLRGQPPA